jgi:hypothetical protein
MEENMSYETDREDLASGEWVGFENEPELLCNHRWPNGTVASSINLELCTIECVICGLMLADLNPFVAPALRVNRRPV